ncbi:MAG: transposase, partial [Candidatus Sulfotelmatobacter sp.]
VLNGVLWILRTGAQWRELPKKYPPYQTCHWRFQQWVRSGQLDKALRALAWELHGHGLLPLEEGLLDGTFAGAKKGSGRGADEARQGDENHGHRCRYQSSSGLHRR